MKTTRNNRFTTLVSSAFSLTCSIFLMAHIASSSASAAALTWDTTLAADGTITSGSGTWTNGAGNWNSGSTSVGVNWNNATPDSAIFAGSATTSAISLGGDINSLAMTFNTSGYTLFNATTARTITSTGNTTLASGVTATIGSNVTVTRGSVDIITTASGAGGTLNIGAADQSSTDAKYVTTQSGSTGARTLSITNGTLVNVNSGGYFGQSPGTAYVTATNPNGTSIVIGSATGGSLVVKTGGTVTNGNNQALILGGASASGTLTIDGGQVNAGTVTVGTTGALPAASAYAGLRFGAGTANASGTRTANLNGGILTVGQIYTGTSAASPTFTNTFNFNGGTLQASIANTTFMTGLTAANVQVGGAKIDTNSFDITIGQALVHDAALGATLDGGLTKNSAGKLTLTNTNTYTGGTAIKNGSLALDGATRILATSSVVLGDTGTTGKLVVGGASVGTQTLASLTTTGLGGSVVGGNASASTLTLAIPTAVNNGFSGTIGGSLTNENNLAVTKSDVGTLTLSGNNSYTGLTTVSTGALNIQHANALGSTTGGTTVASVGSLQLQGGVVFAAEALTLNSNSSSTQNLLNVSGNNEWTGTITHANVATANSVNIGSDAGLLTLSNTLSGAGAPFLFRGASAITVSGKITGASGVISSFTGSGVGSIRTLSNAANDYSGDTLLSGGTFKLGASNVIPDGSSKGNVIFSAASGTATLDLAGRNETINGLASSGLGSNVVDNSTGSTNSTLTVGGNDQSATFNGVIKNTGTSATLALTKTGSGTQTLSGVNTYTGATTISGGTLALGATGSITSPNIILGASTTFDVSGVTGGYTLGAAQTLSGSGSVVGSTVVAGTLSPGNSPGSMSVGSQAWVNDGDYNWQILNATGLAGSGFDTIAMTGTLDLTSLTTGGFGINLWSLASISPDVNGNALNFDNTLTQSWNLLTASVAIIGFDAADFVINTGVANGTGGFGNDLGGGAFSMGTSGNNLVLNFTAIPEPNVAALIGGVGLLSILRRRRN